MNDNYRKIHACGFTVLLDDDVPVREGKKVLCTYEGTDMIRTLSPGNVLTAEGEKPIYAPFATIHGVVYNYYKENLK